MVSKTAIAATILAAAGASASPAAAVKFTSLAARSASPIHYAELTASGQAFYLGGKTATYCPSPPVTQCPKGDITRLVFYNGGLGLDTEVPGGQQVYVGPNGALGFTQAHSAFIPQGSKTDGFTLVDTKNGYSIFGSKYGGFIACPQKGGKQPVGPWKVFVSDGRVPRDRDVPTGKTSDCLGFNALASTTTDSAPAAWQYT